MTNILPKLNRLRRPRILIRAARHGMKNYFRDRDLPRILRAAALPCPATAFDRLLFEEDQIEAKRKTGDASYSIARHVELLIALLSEASPSAVVQVPGNRSGNFT